ncbi:peptidylprolyl isomerase [Mucilaginibacter pocheonensis]|uniref:Peptidyl-prolyl cis-trans isomerase SurA n=1 Tax=Mucilaginibacter pocheonensis TaxID=398050 RepID=A0ABU1T9V1_9SPHI|nr:peptidylprolyl isomerase [Mucilaginibacter pocheonensis]MDR6942177.1 peptidyl-prolyl cis-trans isomerase SurA [Mucilaginibacter pocheonensis]
MRKLGVFILGFIFIISIAGAQTKPDSTAKSLFKSDSTAKTPAKADTAVVAGPRHMLDKIAAVVGNSPILQSDIETQYARYLVEGNQPNPEVKCRVLQSLLTQKLLAQQAAIDSIEVKDDEVDNNVDRRMREMTQRAGGQEKLEAFLGRSVIQYKDEIRPDMKEQMVAQKMQQHITEKLNVTPQDVKKYFESIPKDSLPSFNKEVEVGEIAFQPQLNKEEKELYKQKAEELRQRVKKGEDFGTLARLYSQDPGSAPDGGDLGFADRTTFVKEFTANAFKLKAGEISPVFETDFGFHFLQVIERRGEQVHVRHILITPVITQASLDRAKIKADSIYNLMIKNKKIDFSSAAAYYSDDKDTKYNGGMMLNAENVQSRSTYIPTDKLDPKVALTVDTMKIGSISKPDLFTDAGGKKSYKILYLKSATNAHKANLEQDFPKLKDMAYEDKNNRVISQWFEKRRKETFIKIDQDYQSCDVLKKWITASPATAQVKP